MAEEAKSAMDRVAYDRQTQVQENRLKWEQKIYPEQHRLQEKSATTDFVRAAAPAFSIMQPLIWGFVIIFLLVGPGFMGITNILYKSNPLMWVGAIFVLVLLLKMGVLGKR